MMKPVVALGYITLHTLQLGHKAKNKFIAN